MGIHQELLSLDGFFVATTGNKVILNDLDIYSIEDIRTVNSKLMTVYEGNAIDTIPTCDCGHFKDRYLLNKVCPECNTPVVDPQDQMSPVMWMKALEGMNKFINPQYWHMLKILVSTKIDYIRWLVDSSYNPPVQPPAFMYGALDIIGGQRDYQALTNNLDKLLIFFLNQSKFKDPDSQYSINFLLTELKDHPDRVFTNYLPIVNKKLFVMENTTKGKFTNLSVSEMIELIMLWVKYSSENLSMRRKSNLVGNILSKMSTLFKTYFDDYVSSKIGVFRKHVYSARSNFTFRGVISPITGPHRYDEIHIPWSMAVVVLRPHLLNKLRGRGYAHKKASSMLFAAVKRHNPLIEELLNELLTEAPGGVIKVIQQRNPSLERGSAQIVDISKIKMDPEDYTVSLSILICKAYNADFDGDF